VKLLAFLGVSAVLFFAVASWPALRSDWDYWTTKRAYDRLRIGEPKSQVQSSFGRPPFTEDGDRCWYDHETRWPGGGRLYTLCFEHGRLVSKNVDGG
jgi:outer membrane protein assembly factor BamE (lipoprotein component of BamABCDE complex)